MKVNINAVETNQKVDEGFLFFRRDLLQERVCYDLPRGEWFVDWDIKHKSLGINVTDVDTPFMSEQYNVAFALRVNTDIVFGVRGMRKEGFDDEVVQSPSYTLDLKSRQSREQILGQASRLVTRGNP